ncbi:Mevalonate kinase [Sporothrix epigloea]|uniref:Mevalonate kinase n=1 Tax=Sporothrix epigloea TaxID=1892477 RepID=A0ABP0DXZ0_9PEZI
MTAKDDTTSVVADAEAKALHAQSRYKMSRKASSPMMPAFMVSAPGKVIVFGEHSVVHGKAAIAAAISLRSYLLVTALSKSKRTLTLRFPDIDMSHTWNIDELPWEIFSKPGKKKFYYDLVTALDQDLLDAIQPHLANVSLLKFPGCIYTLRSTIPIGAGLGSSASIAVCISTALLLQLRTLSGPHPDQPADEARLQIERINRWAFVAEMCIHGNPSGVDNTVATQGKAVVFKRVESKPPAVRSLWSFPELPLLLVDTKQPKSTKHEVAKVARLKRNQPEIVDNILNAMDAVTRSAISVFESETSSKLEEENDAPAIQSLKLHENGQREDADGDMVAAIGSLMTINHGLLSALGVSHPRLERVRELVDYEGLGWTKLTGAGGGGCSITLIKRSISRSRVLELEQQLAQEGYQQFVTTLGGSGVGVLWPAVLRNGTVDDEEGGIEIDMEKFLNAEGNEGVERLVGVEGGDGEREGWKFWRM